MVETWDFMRLTNICYLTIPILIQSQVSKIMSRKCHDHDSLENGDRLERGKERVMYIVMKNNEMNLHVWIFLSEEFFILKKMYNGFGTKSSHSACQIFVAAIV